MVGPRQAESTDHDSVLLHLASPLAQPLLPPVTRAVQVGFLGVCPTGRLGPSPGVLSLHGWGVGLLLPPLLFPEDVPTSIPQRCLWTLHPLFSDIFFSLRVVFTSFSLLPIFPRSQGGTHAGSVQGTQVQTLLWLPSLLGSCGLISESLFL